MSGTTSLCLTQQWNNTTHEPLVGGLLYSFVAGTLTPQNAYRTAALASGGEYPNPVTLDASGRIPQMFYADGVIRLILTDSLGVAQFDYDNVPVIGSSGGGGGVDTTDVNRLFSTGDIKIKYGTGTIEGYVRGNGRTIGSFTSGASEYFAADAQALFQYFWNTDPTLAVSTGRGVSAILDWQANKQIATPDFRGYVIGGLDGMGNTRASRLAAAGWDALSTGFGGLETHTLTQTQLPSVNLVSSSLSFTGTASGTLTTGYQSGVPGQAYTHSHSTTIDMIHNGAFPAGGFNITGPAASLTSARTSNDANTDHYHYFSFTPAGSVGGHVPLGGSSAAYPILQPTRLVTVYFRL